MTSSRTALLSVSDKQGLIPLARALAAAGVDILSTGGTASQLVEAGIAVTKVSDYTGFPEIMDGRVKTLHPRIHGGLLGRRGVDDDTMREHGIRRIDVLVVNLYPFRETIARPDCTTDQAFENIDIGGPAMLRAAAKNHRDVFVVTDPDDYDALIKVLDAPPTGSSDFRRTLSAKAFAHVAAYDRSIAEYLGAPGDAGEGELPARFAPQFDKTLELRYGENPHQRAAFYAAPNTSPGTLASGNLLQGKALSFNNIADADAALACVRQFEAPACVIVKHANPCGVALGADLGTAYQRAFATDPTSAFGGIIAVNRGLDGDTARAIIDQQFVEVIVAPDFSSDARAALAAKPNLRALRVGDPDRVDRSVDVKSVGGGLLVQDTDIAMVSIDQLHTVTKRAPTAAEIEDLLFAWKVCKFVKSNAIVYARERTTVGVGAGQMSRVYSARIAAIKAADAGLEVRGSVMASDAFFPFRDGLDHAASEGVCAVIQPGGSRRDEEVIAAADEHGLAMVFTGMRHFRH